MDRPSDLKRVRKPADLAGTVLDRREFMHMVQAGGGLVLGSSLAGCTGFGDDDDGTEEFVIARPEDADILDPHKTNRTAAEQVMALLYDGMILMDEDRNSQEMLGKGFEVSDDGTVWTIEFHVDRDITFHNGKEFTVDDVVFTYERFLEESILRSWSVGSLQEVEKLDEETVRFTFDEPYAFFDQHVAANSYFGILPEDLAGMSAEEFGQDPIGTGPYSLEEWIDGERIVLARNDDWNTPTYDVVEAEDPPLPQRIVWRTIPSDTPRIQSLLSGDVDAITEVPPLEREDLQSTDDVNLHSNIGNSIVFMPIHNQLAPTDDVQVRQAIAHSIDRERIVEDIYYGAGTVNYSLMPAGYPAWAGETVRDEIGYVYDPERASELLTDAGWEDTGGEYRERDGETLMLEMVTTNTPPTKLQTSEEIAAMLADVGIDVNLNTTQPAQAQAEMAEGETHLMNASLAWFTPDVMQFMLSSAVVGASNLSFTEDEQIDQYLVEAARTLDETERHQIYEDLQLRAMEICAAAPIMTDATEVAIHSDFTGYHYVPGAGGDIWYDIRRDE